MFRTVLAIVWMVTQACPTQATGLDPEVARTASDQLLGQFAAGLATLANPGEPMTAKVETDASGHKVIFIVGANGREPERVVAIYGSGDFAGLPIQLNARAVTVDLRPEWLHIIANVKGLRQGYEAVGSTAIQPFGEFIRSRVNLEELLAPIETAVEKFAHDVLTSEVRQAARAEGERRRSEEILLTLQAERISTGVSLAAYAVGVALILSSLTDFWDMLFAPVRSSQYQYIGGGFAGFYAFLSGFTFNLVTAANFLSGYVRDSGTDFITDFFSRRLAGRRHRAELAEFQREVQEERRLIEVLRRHPTEHRFGRVTVSLFSGPLTDVAAGSWVIPQGPVQASRHGEVPRALRDAQGDSALTDYENSIGRNGGPFEFGRVIATTSVGSPVTTLLHAVVNGAGRALRSPVRSRQMDFSTAKLAYLNALKTSSERGLGTMATPLLLTGADGSLLSEHSLNALLEAIQEFNSTAPGESQIKVTIAIDRAPYVNQALERRLVTADRNGIERESNLVVSPTDVCYANLNAAQDYQSTRK